MCADTSSTKRPRTRPGPINKPGGSTPAPSSSWTRDPRLRHEARSPVHPLRPFNWIAPSWTHLEPKEGSSRVLTSSSGTSCAARTFSSWTEGPSAAASRTSTTESTRWTASSRTRTTRPTDASSISAIRRTTCPSRSLRDAHQAHQDLSRLRKDGRRGEGRDVSSVTTMAQATRTSRPACRPSGTWNGTRLEADHGPDHGAPQDLTITLRVRASSWISIHAC